MMLKTHRLRLRQWTEADRQPFVAMNRDPDVMRYFPRLYTEEESNQYVDAQIKQIATQGWGSWAVETQDTNEFIGFVGLSRPASWHPCASDVEIGWRLAARFWHRGYATEAALRAVDYGFKTIELDEIVSFTACCNAPSIRIMQKIGMIDDGVGFEHPRIEPNSVLRKHVVYRLSKDKWQSTSDAQSN